MTDQAVEPGLGRAATLGSSAAGSGAAGSNAAWFERARRVIPGGVDSPVRSFQSVGGTPFTVVSGEGPYVTDVEGNRYIDLVQSYGAVLLGHAHPVVVEALRRAVSLGSSFGMPTTGETLLAEAISAQVPGCEQVRFVSSGTEAGMTALRLCRGATGRTRVVKFDGCYHGHSDSLLAGGGSGIATLGLPGSAGVPPAAVADTLVVPYNVVPELDASIACVIVEPVAANMNLVPPAPGFLEGLRAACDAAGALLVFDEVITGWRVGRAAASAALGVVPDLWCFGKVIGGGLPVGAIGGGRDLLASLAPTGPVYQAGTLSGNPLATAAGRAVLEHLGTLDHADLCRRVERFASQLAASVRDGGLPAAAACVGALSGLYLGPPGSVVEVPTDYESSRTIAEGGVYAPFFHAMLRRGVAMAPGAYEVLFCGFAHDERVLERVVELARDAAAEVARDLSS